MFSQACVIPSVHGGGGVGFPACITGHIQEGSASGGGYLLLTLRIFNRLSVTLYFFCFASQIKSIFFTKLYFFHFREIWILVIFKNNDC